ncbi:hypothetical protein EOS93_25255 [Rhizobium sp. RMa-01]|uniref:hypothetical protein n=1 Tax=unclassified Rhizobium TaxID=2613769 RepID=UPI0008DAEE4E|nr:MULTISPECIES: hypothetical protein [unclassified Rhizobium]OHV25106.1 hypothetical protein BBJ66_22580 [Rhizobium sp. RSm-3]RVU08391.1 hypothetical protein EOS93_25255 [Rhizobium sp. RMa-01]
MRVLVACEFSGTVRRAFTARGHDAWSCDLIPAEDRSNKHIIGDARDILHDGWDLLIVAHPPCTRLCNSGISWLSTPPKGKTIEQMWRELDAAADLFSAFWNAPIDRICIENPVMHRHAKARIDGYAPPAQTVAPWQFGEPLQKKICLWLKNLPALEPTKIVPLPEPEYCIRRSGPRAGEPYRYYFHQGKSGHERSRFFAGIAEAMADQWGELPAQGDLFMRRAAV